MSQNVNVNLVPGNYPKEFHVSQYDVGRQLVAKVVDSTGDYSIPSGATVVLVGTKPSGFGFSLNGTVSGSTVTFSTTATVTAEYGRIPCEIRVTNGETVLGTANLMLIVEESPHQEGVIDGNSETVIPELTILVERVEAAASSVLDMQVEADTLPAGSSATYSYDEETNTATFGIPQGEAGAGAAGVVASAYSASSTYAVGDYVIHDGNLYRCTTAITTAEAFTAAHWTQAVLGDDVSDLKSDLNENLMDFVEAVNPTNWFNNDGLVAGELLADGTVSASTTRKYTDYFIPVTAGLKVWYNRGDNFGAGYMRHLTVFDANKNIISAKGSNSADTSYLIQNDVAFVKVTIDNPYLPTNPMITVGESSPTVYSAYFQPYTQLTKDFLTSEGQEVVTKLKEKSYNTSDLLNKYACSLPRTKLRQTVGIEETFYTDTARTPSKTTFCNFNIGDHYQQRITEDSILLPNIAAFSSVNGFRWSFIDSAFAEISNNLTETYQSGFPRSIIAENLASCSLLAIGDSTVDQDTMTQKLLDHFTESGATLTLLGTLGSGNNKNEGRAGWKASDYLTDRQYSGVTNPFYNPTSQTFDFSYYMTNQGYNAPDFVILQLGINDLGSTDDYAEIWECITTMIDSIFSYNNSIKIILNLPTTPTNDQSKIQSMYLPNYQNRAVNYDEYAIIHSLAEYGETKVRCSYCHVILDPDTDISDNVHPNAGGYEKMALEIVNQINHWQNND